MSSVKNNGFTCCPNVKRPGLSHFLCPWSVVRRVVDPRRLAVSIEVARASGLELWYIFETSK